MYHIYIYVPYVYVPYVYIYIYVYVPYICINHGTSFITISPGLKPTEQGAGQLLGHGHETVLNGGRLWFSTGERRFFVGIHNLDMDVESWI